MSNFTTKLSARIALGAVLALGALGAGAYASAQMTDPQPGDVQPTFPEESARATAPAVEDALAAAFSVLRRDRAPGDALSAATQDNLTKRSAAFGPNVSLSRRSQTTDGLALFVIPGNDSVCLEAVGSDPLGGSGGGCARAEQALDGYMIHASLTRGGIRVMGLLPDGAGDVDLVLASGKRLPVPVVNNVYTAELTESLTGIEFTLDGERRQMATPFEMVGLAQEQNGKPVRIR